MLLTDVNVLIYAFRPDAVDHQRYKDWLDDVANSDEPYGISELAFSGFLRIVTHPGIFDPPSELDEALSFLEVLRSQPNCVVQAPSSRHWDIFAALCPSVGARGKLVPDAYC